MLNTESALRTVRRVLAADCACGESLFGEEGVFVVEAKEMEGRRRFPFREKSLGAVTMGTGVVVTCSADRLQWARDNLAGLGRADVFSSPAIALMHEMVARDDQVMSGIHLHFVVARGRFRPHSVPGVDIKIVHEDGIPGLYAIGGFPNALSYEKVNARADVLAAVARQGGRVVGMAGASADSDEMWQIGIDVVPDCRERGIGKALVGRVTAAVFDAGKLPYYGTSPSNLASRSLALSLGYVPAWTEVFAREKRAQ